jgi:hypothetical protein
MGRNIIDLTGQKFGLLTVQGYSHTNIHAYWHCLCDCGNKKIASSTTLKSGRVRSCGCLFRGRKVKYENKSEGAIEKVLDNYIRGAKRRKLQFDLSKKSFIKKIEGNCHYCGREPETESYYRGFCVLYNGIDRKDNKLGYTEENSVTCCSMCNKMKMEMNHDSFIKIVKLIAVRF